MCNALDALSYIAGGNKFRGLLNITLKSLGAAVKRHPDVCLTDVIGYGQPLPRDASYAFMDSPGADPESISGQVASGCQLVYFTTGNGSITNHPLAPTIKIVTTSPRFNLLEKDMDVNAGRLLDGEPMEKLVSDTLALTLRVASGLSYSVKS